MSSLVAMMLVRCATSQNGHLQASPFMVRGFLRPIDMLKSIKFIGCEVCIELHFLFLLVFKKTSSIVTIKMV